MKIAAMENDMNSIHIHIGYGNTPLKSVFTIQKIKNGQI